ncbi:Gfo/Idh/MocA family oxidoreductase [Streptomyces sp. TR06-5]|uniref:Gfo/Idh/MocA family protein n=1 Tax=unclassified Streptomyces TaxID=2593676 RepID=UPI0039A3B63A
MQIGLLGTGRIGALHARTLRDLPGVDDVLVADPDAPRARALAAELGLRPADGVEELFAARPDAVVIAAATSAHAPLLHRSLDDGIPVFCEKPVAPDVRGTAEIAGRAEATGVPVQIGFQRRFDAGYREARRALRAGELGRLHTLRAVTADQSPPHASYLPTSGGLFRDCSIHDFDILRWLTGREVVSAYALGSDRGADFFREAGDIDTGAALLRFDDDVLATVTATRYNGAGHDVRLEVCGVDGSRIVGLDDRAPLPSAEPRLSWRRDRPYATFADRFASAYAAELAAFVDVAAGRSASPCTPGDALEALHVAEACERSRRTGRPVEVAEVRR